MTSRQDGRAASAGAAPRSGTHSGTVLFVVTIVSLSRTRPPQLSGSIAQIAGVARPVADQAQPRNSGPTKKAGKEKCHNWSVKEVTALIDVKRIMDDHEKNCKDQRELMIPEAGKWQYINDVINRRLPSSARDAASYKSKWNLLIAEYKRIVDFQCHDGSNDVAYWNISPSERKAEGLQRTSLSTSSSSFTVGTVVDPQ